MSDGTPAGGLAGGIGMALRISGESARCGAPGLGLAGFGVLFLGIDLLRAASSGQPARHAPVESGAFVAQAKSLLDAADPEAAPDERRSARPGLQATS